MPLASICGGEYDLVWPAIAHLVTPIGGLVAHVKKALSESYSLHPSSKSLALEVRLVFACFYLP
jgi:hypothetical protein